MSLEKRLKKIEGLAGEKTKDFAPVIITLYEDDNTEAILKRLKAKYGEGYEPHIIIQSTETRESARKNHGYLYREIEDLQTK